MRREEIELFPRKYRHFFTDPERGVGGCKPLHITVASPYKKILGLVDKEALGNYIADFRDLFAIRDREMYDFTVKYIWLRSRFGYIRGRIARDDNDRTARKAFAIFLNKYVGIERRHYLVHGNFIETLKRFLPEFFPGFYDFRNPLKENLAFPFKNISLSHLTPVREMDEAIGLLQYADSKNLGFNDFMDFLANWTACYNEKYGEKYRMEVRPLSSNPIYVINLVRREIRARERKQREDESELYE